MVIRGFIMLRIIKITGKKVAVIEGTEGHIMAGGDGSKHPGIAAQQNLFQGKYIHTVITRQIDIISVVADAAGVLVIDTAIGMVQRGVPGGAIGKADINPGGSTVGHIPAHEISICLLVPVKALRHIIVHQARNPENSMGIFKIVPVFHSNTNMQGGK